jgi:hypothetical protein
MEVGIHQPANNEGKEKKQQVKPALLLRGVSAKLQMIHSNGKRN